MKFCCITLVFGSLVVTGVVPEALWCVDCMEQSLTTGGQSRPASSISNGIGTKATRAAHQMVRTSVSLWSVLVIGTIDRNIKGTCRGVDGRWPCRFYSCPLCLSDGLYMYVPIALTGWTKHEPNIVATGTR